MGNKSERAVVALLATSAVFIAAGASAQIENAVNRTSTTPSAGEVKPSKRTHEAPKTRSKKDHTTGHGITGREGSGGNPAIQKLIVHFPRGVAIEGHTDGGGQTSGNEQDFPPDTTSDIAIDYNLDSNPPSIEVFPTGLSPFDVTLRRGNANFNLGGYPFDYNLRRNTLTRTGSSKNYPQRRIVRKTGK